MWWV